MKPVSGLAALALLAALCASAHAGTMVYKPYNPSFGGDALNSSHLLGLASAQRTATASDAKPDGSGGLGGGDGSTTGSTEAQLFLAQLQSRLLSALASQVTEAIFGQNPQDFGTVTFGTTTITFDRLTDPAYIILTIVEGLNTTEIKVPVLITTP